MDNSLFNILKKHRERDIISFHTPGHKGNAEEVLGDILSLKYDLTELSDTDELYAPVGAIAVSECIASEIYNSKGTFFSAGGCSLCIQTMLRLIFDKSGGKLIAGRVIHKTAVNTMALLNIEPVWVLPKEKGDNLPGEIRAGDIEKAILENPDAKAVYITTPDYYGCISDVKRIAETCHKFNLPLLVDRAHGAHLPFIESTKEIISGADMYADSAHKTLPVLTGGAFLNIYNSDYCKNAKRAMALFGSTSPSYLIMASLDRACKWLSENPEPFKRAVEFAEYIKNAAIKSGFKVAGGLTDPARVSVNTGSLGIDGNSGAEFLEKMGIAPEYSDSGWIVFIISPFNTENEIEVLAMGLTALAKNRERLEKSAVGSPAIGAITERLPNKKISVREAVFSESKSVSLKSALGKIASDTVCPCPPGIPVVMPGEVIDKRIIDILSLYKIENIDIVI